MGKMWIETLEVAGINPAIRGMRNPLNSWDKSDTIGTAIGTADMELAQRLVRAGSEHSKFLRQIQVWANVNMPRYWWADFDTYKFGTKNSCSTMHKLFHEDREVSIEEFVYDSLDEYDIITSVKHLNRIREQWLSYRKSGDTGRMTRCVIRAKRILPEGFLQMRTLNTNYAELMNAYHQRKTHRLKEEFQDVFCRWCETLPYFIELCIEPKERRNA